MATFVSFNQLAGSGSKVDMRLVVSLVLEQKGAWSEYSMGYVLPHSSDIIAPLWPHVS